VIDSGFHESVSHLVVECGDSRITFECHPDTNGVRKLSVVGGAARRLDQGSECEYISKQDFDRLIKDCVLDQTFLEAFLMEHRL
jgi:hypothetical protein